MNLADLNVFDFNVAVLMPELLMIGFAVLVMMLDVFTSEEEGSAGRQSIAWAALIGVIVTIVICFRSWDGPINTFQGSAISDHFALGLRLIVLTATGLGIMLSMSYIPQVNRQIGEYYALILLTAVGMMMMGTATDLIVVFIALEIFSLALYILTGLHRESPRSSEASMKYFLLGAFASAFFVYGAALIYGATGSTQYDTIAAMLGSGQGDLNLLYPGIALLIVGFGFKVSLVPFHMWTPDVYQGAPTPVTAFMSVGTKAAGFAAFVRFFVVALPSEQATWGGALAILAVLTMILGNLAALRQTSLKRMLAYSGIAHAGYVLVGLVPGTVEGADAALFYLFAYAFMNIGAFAVVIMLEKNSGGLDQDPAQNRAAGLGATQPLLAIAMAIFMFSLTGFPPLAGFFGKIFVFKAAVTGGWAWLAAIAMINSVIGAYYYLRVVISMYFEESNGITAIPVVGGNMLKVGVAIMVIFTVIIGIYPSLWMQLFEGGIMAFGG